MAKITMEFLKEQDAQGAIRYIGDGIYFYDEGWCFWLLHTNGVEVLDQICIEHHMFKFLAHILGYDLIKRNEDD